MLLLIIFDRVYHIDSRFSFLMTYVYQYKAPVTFPVKVVWKDHKLVIILDSRCHNLEDIICLVVIHHACKSLVRAEVDRFLRVEWLFSNEFEESLDGIMK
jgi:hypothetical protein